MDSLKRALMCLFVLAIVFVSFSCRNASDGRSDDDQQEQLQDLESYIFLRHRFAEENAEISYEASNEEKLAWSKKHFAHIKEYMPQKINDFRRKVRDLEPVGNFLQPICDEIWGTQEEIRDYDNGGSGIDPVIGRNEYNFSNLLGAIAAKFVINNKTPLDPYDYYQFEAHYAALALSAYNDSLGKLHHSERFQLNKDRGAINNALIGEPVWANYAATDTNNVEKGLKEILDSVSRETGVSVDTLIDAVNLNLLNVGMWGARDLGATAGFQLSSADKLLRPSLTNLNRRDLIHNMGTWEEYYIVKYYDREQENNQNRSQTQEQGNSL